MKKFRITHYSFSTSLWYTNGGKLIVTENEYIIKYLFQTVTRFEIDKTVVTKIPGILFTKGINLSDGVKNIDLWFFTKAAERLYKILDNTKKDSSNL